MTREYELKRRAEQMEDTRRRIVEAACELHETIGPARTSVSAIAERAGVQRQTYYRHFPDERSLRRACSGLNMEGRPLPDAARWREIADPYERLRVGLTQLYDYYQASEQLLANVMRDAEVDPLTRETMNLRLAAMSELREALVDGLRRERSIPNLDAVLSLVMDFNTWRVLVRRNHLAPVQAVELGMAIIRCAR